jgi:hypothetical protein
MRIYIVKCSGDDDTTIVWVGTDEEEAFKTVEDQVAERNYITVWENGKEVSEYYRDAWYSDPNKSLRYDRKHWRFDKWERNSGEKIPRLEI